MGDMARVSRAFRAAAYPAVRAARRLPERAGRPDRTRGDTSAAGLVPPGAGGASRAARG